MNNRMKAGTAVAAAAAAFIGAFEGLRQHAYPDPASRGPPWTICYGHTKGVKPGDYKTIEECKRLLIAEIGEYARGIERCVNVHLPDKRYIALTSFAYNVGVGAACKSSVVRFINQGRIQEGCDALLRWNKAAGITFPGLTRRRQAERRLCLEEA